MPIAGHVKMHINNLQQAIDRSGSGEEVYNDKKKFKVDIDNMEKLNELQFTCLRYQLLYR